MPDLVDVLASAANPLGLYKGQVAAVIAGLFDISYGGGVVKYASKLDGGSYSVGDWVIFTLGGNVGPLILGKQTMGTPQSIPAPVTGPLIVNATGSASYDSTTGTWTAATITQSPTSYGLWFYNTPTAFTTVATAALASFEIEVTRTSGGPPEFRAHGNASGTGDLVLLGDLFGTTPPPVGVATWQALPIDWGQQLALGTIQGVAIGGGLFTGSYSGTGRVRLTPV